MISVHFQGKSFNITVIQVYALTNNAEEAEVEWLCEDLQDLLELIPKKDVLFIIYTVYIYTYTVPLRQCQRMLKLPHNCTHLTH